MADTLLAISLRSIVFSGLAVALSASWSIPLAYWEARRGGGAAVHIAESLVGVPTVLVGLLVYALLSRSGPLGFLGLLYTPAAVVIGEAILVTPLLVAVSYRVLRAAYATVGELALSLGASDEAAMKLVLREAIPGLASSAVMAFSRAIGELGVALLVGGNIAGYTRTLTTAIALEVEKGEFEQAIGMGLVLLALSVLLSAPARLAAERWTRWRQ